MHYELQEEKCALVLEVNGTKCSERKHKVQKAHFDDFKSRGKMRPCVGSERNEVQ